MICSRQTIIPHTTDDYWLSKEIFRHVFGEFWGPNDKNHIHQLYLKPQLQIPSKQLLPSLALPRLISVIPSLLLFRFFLALHYFGNCWIFCWNILAKLFEQPSRQVLSSSIKQIFTVSWNSHVVFTFTSLLNAKTLSKIFYQPCNIQSLLLSC